MYVKGFIPETLPDIVSSDASRWLHIDINNARLTSVVLDRYLMNAAPGSIALLDDYAHIGFEDTRNEVDDYIRQGKSYFSLEVLPTGQAMIEKV